MDDPSVQKEKAMPRKSSGVPDPKDFLMKSTAYNVLSSYLLQLKNSSDKLKGWFGKPSKRQGYLNDILTVIQKMNIKDGFMPHSLRKLSELEKYPEEPIAKLFSSKSTPEHVKNAIVALSEKAKEYLRDNDHQLNEMWALTKEQVTKIIDASGLKVSDGDEIKFKEALQKYLNLDQQEAQKITVMCHRSFRMVNVGMSSASIQKLKDLLDEKPQMTAEKTSRLSSSQQPEPEKEKPSPRRGPGMG